MHRTRQRQRGIALITALLVVAIATVAAVEMAFRHQLDIRRTQNTLARDQAYAYLVSAEGGAFSSLKSDLFGGNVDHLGENWRKPFLVPDFEGAQLQGQIGDLQGRFNLNNLYFDLPPEQQQQLAQDPNVQCFRRLLEGLRTELPEDTELNVDVLMDRLLDWLDPDVQLRPNGAEDLEYISLQDRPPHRAGNQRLADASELLLIEGFTPEIYRALAPLVSALPEQGSKINVNTAPPQVLACLHPQLNLETAQQLAKEREQTPWKTVEDFKNNSLVKNLDLNDQTAQMLGVQSYYFSFQATVSLGPALTQLYSVIRRAPDKSISVVSRRRSIPEEALANR